MFCCRWSSRRSWNHQLAAVGAYFDVGNVLGYTSIRRTGSDSRQAIRRVHQGLQGVGIGRLLRSARGRCAWKETMSAACVGYDKTLVAEMMPPDRHCSAHESGDGQDCEDVKSEISNLKFQIQENRWQRSESLKPGHDGALSLQAYRGLGTGRAWRIRTRSARRGSVGHGRKCAQGRRRSAAHGQIRGTTNLRS